MLDRVSTALKLLLQDGPQGFALTAADATILYASPSITRVLGYLPEDLVGSNAAYLIHAEDRNRAIEQAASELASPGSSTILQCRCRHRDGSWRWIEVSLTNLLHDSEADAVTLVFRDISAAKQREAALQADHVLLRAVVEGTPDAIFVKDLEGRYRMINSVGAQLLGKSVEEVVGRKTTDVFSADSAPHIIDADQRIIASGKAQTLEYSATAAGVTRTYRSSRGVYRDDRGEIIGVVGISRDVTEQQQVAQALQKANEDLRAIVESAPVAIVALDLRGHVTTWNPAAERIFGWSQEEALGELPPFIPDCHDQTYLERLYRAVNEGVFTVQEVRRLRKDGAWVDASLVVAALRDDSGELTGFMSVLMDITERKQAEAALLAMNMGLEDCVRQRTAELERAIHELEAFSYSISHDLRNPITIISGYSRALMDMYGEQLGIEGRKLLERILMASERMAGLIDALLNLAKASNSELGRERVDLDQLCRGIVEGLCTIDPRRVVDVQIEPGLSAQGDPTLLAAVMDNLLRNAWKFTGKCVAAQIKVGAILKDGERVYYVKDNGVGFEPADATKLFGAFKRLHHWTEYPGSGIGLATVQRIIERHHGHIWAEGKMNEGATIYFTLGPDGGFPA